MNDTISNPINKEDVRLAIIEINGNGEKPTNELIRKILNRGSFSTIQKYKKEILLEEQTTIKSVVSSKIMAQVELLASTILEESTSKLVASETEFKAQLESIEGRFIKSEERAERLSRKLDDEMKDSAKLRIQITEQSKEMDKTNNTLNLRDLKIESLSQIIQNNENQIKHLINVDGQLKLTITENKTQYAKEKSALETKHAEERNKLSQIIDDTGNELKANKALSEDQNRDIIELYELLEKEQEAQNTLTKNLAAETKALSKAIKINSELTAQLSEEKTKRDQESKNTNEIIATIRERELNLTNQNKLLIQEKSDLLSMISDKLNK
ncbi:DNA-binding protein [Psychromonas sp. SP041]|uniref:DNA-binding protein n=1 Tax=Psychromonas sp. SP041 TaxID=1365007 RepID=UPI0010C77852|nr:DNA-binding protein [Psychromonas sp. SP041]